MNLSSMRVSKSAVGPEEEDVLSFEVAGDDFPRRRGELGFLVEREFVQAGEEGADVLGSTEGRWLD